MKLKAKVKGNVKTQLRTGNAPGNSFKNHPEIRRALKLVNRLDAGIDLDLSETSYKELVMLEHVNRWRNEAVNEYNKRIEKEL